jgi:5'-nucleotidase
MRLLLTNDDGLQSNNLKALHARLAREHDVWVVAPDSERSGSSHAMTLKRAIGVKKQDGQLFSCSGTPVDCVVLAVLGLIDSPIDLVLSGPNAGANLGTDIIYSGTAAAARQAVLMGIPAVAASLAFPASEGIKEFAIEFLARNLSSFRDLSSEDHFLNINFPESLGGAIEIRITHPSLRIYDDILDIENQGEGSLTCRITGPPPDAHWQEGSDHHAVSAGAISLSPIYTHPINHRIESRYRATGFWIGET